MGGSVIGCEYVVQISRDAYKCMSRHQYEVYRSQHVSPDVISMLIILSVFLVAALTFMYIRRRKKV